MTWATTSRTRHRAHSVGACHCCGDSVARNAAKSVRSSRARRRTSTIGRLAKARSRRARALTDSACGHPAEAGRGGRGPAGATLRMARNSRSSERAVVAAPAQAHLLIPPATAMWRLLCPLGEGLDAVEHRVERDL